MHSRIDLHNVLLTYCDNVYFQPPTNVTMIYPAIRYEISDIPNNYADDTVYKQGHMYQVTIIDKDPDSIISDQVSKLPTCRFNRFYTSDNLNHFVYILHY